MTKRYYIPIEHEGQKKTLAISEAVYKEMLEKFSAKEKLPETILLRADAYRVPIKGVAIMIHDPIYAPYKPASFIDIEKIDLKFNPKSKVMLRYAKTRVNPSFFGTITFPALKHVVPGGIKDAWKSWDNPCAEVGLGPIDSCLASGKRLDTVVAPTGDGKSLLYDMEQVIGNAINESAKRILTPGFIADPKAYPHKCPRCKSPAYVGLQTVDCSKKSCS